MSLAPAPGIRGSDSTGGVSTIDLGAEPRWVSRPSLPGGLEHEVESNSSNDPNTMEWRDRLNRVITSLGKKWKRGIDGLLGVNTIDQPQTGESLLTSSRHGDQHAYSSPDYIDLWRIASRLGLRRSDVVFDLGCGLGRFVCVCALYRVRRVVAIEIDPGLAAACRENAARLARRASPVEVRVEDAAETSVAGGTVFFLFNPFGVLTLKSVLSNIAAARPMNGASRRLLYLNPSSSHDDILQHEPALRLVATWRTLRGLTAKLYRVDGAAG